MNKPCSSQTPAPPRKRKEPKPTRVAELERRLEDLTSRLDTVSRQHHHQQQLTPPESSDTVSPSPLPHFKDNPACMPFVHLFPTEKPAGGIPQAHDASPPRFDHAFPRDDRQPEQSPSSVGTDDDDAPMPPAPPPAASTREYSGIYPNATRDSQSPEMFWPQADEAEEMLREYREGSEGHFVFVTIPPNTTAEELRRKRPYVWKAVMMTACHLDGPRQIILGDQLVRDISEAAIFKPQKSLDLLQGLQLILGW